MGHVYANLAEFKAYLSDGNYGTVRDDSLLTLLESSSRRVDGFTKRGSQFGPVVETRHYTARGRTLRLLADVISITTVTRNGTELDPEDYTLDGRTLIGPFGVGASVDIEMITGYPAEVISSGAALDASLADNDATATVDDGTLISPGMTLLIDDEQLQVLAVAAEVVTLLRGANGTTAANHADTTSIDRYRYASEATDATIRVAQRRWKMRDAGLTPDFGGGAMPLVSNRDSERSILAAALGHLQFAFVR